MQSIPDKTAIIYCRVSSHEQVQGTSLLRIESVHAVRAERARAMFFRRSDKDYSFTDCTSFVIMKELKIHMALTLDDHFQQAGFNTVPQ